MRKSFESKIEKLDLGLSEVLSDFRFTHHPMSVQTRKSEFEFQRCSSSLLRQSLTGDLHQIFYLIRIKQKDSDGASHFGNIPMWLQ